MLLPTSNKNICLWCFCKIFVEAASSSFLVIPKRCLFCFLPLSCVPCFCRGIISQKPQFLEGIWHLIAMGEGDRQLTAFGTYFDKGQFPFCLCWLVLFCSFVAWFFINCIWAFNQVFAFLLNSLWIFIPCRLSPQIRKGSL